MLVTRFETGEGITILRLDGKLIASTLDNLKASLDSVLSSEEPFILLNFKDVNAMDTFVVGLLLSRSKSVENQKGLFVFCEMSPAIEALLKQSGKEKPPIIHKTEGEAIEEMHSKLKVSDKQR